MKEVKILSLADVVNMFLNYSDKHFIGLIDLFQERQL